MSARGLHVSYGAAATLLALPIIAGAAWSPLAWLLLGLLVAGAIGFGIVRYSPTPRWPWLVIAAAIPVSALTDLVYGQTAGDAGVGLLTVVHLLYLGTFVGITGALLRMRRSDNNGLAPAALLDTIAVTVVLLLVLWVFVISPGEPDPDAFFDPATLAYPIGGALVLTTAARLVLVGPPNRSARVLVGAAASALGAHLARTLEATEVVGSLAFVENVGWLLWFILLGLAGLDPSMAHLGETEPPALRKLTLRRFWPIAVAALVAPVLLLGQSLLGAVQDGIALALAGSLLTLVALARVATTANSQSRAVAYRERLDTLTGLSSRMHLMDRLTAGPEASWSALMLLDLDNFRQVNDAGHSVGDEVLLAVARRLLRHTGRDDLVARFGGDEFAILVGAPARDVDAIAMDIAAAIAAPVVVGGRKVAVSACVGLAAAGTSNGEELLRQAGLALQAAKDAGPGEWCRYDSDKHGRLIERLRLRESLTQAITDGAFRLVYQPIVALPTGETVGFEALVRWEHPTRGMIPPSEFITIAEETGLIEEIGDLVLRTAIAEALDWSQATHIDPYVSVNVSPRQLREPGFAERVEQLLTSSALPAGRLMLELTESVVTKGTDHVWAELATLRDMGVRLAIDDFGTGYSSLAYLEQTPIGAIKLDKSFVGSMVASPRQRTVVEGILQMAARLGMHVVAEGIETPSELDLLAELSCPYGQGYLYSTPLSGVEAIRWLTRPPARQPSAKPTTSAPNEESTVERETADPPASAAPMVPTQAESPDAAIEPSDAATDPSNPAPESAPSGSDPPGSDPPGSDPPAAAPTGDAPNDMMVG